jgi:acyl-CoA thioester hydrolase
MNEFILPLTIYIEDTDYTGLVYHARYLNFFERARSTWIAKLGMGMDWQQQQEIYFVVCSAKLDFIKPARLALPVEVVTRVRELKRASLIFEQELRLSDQTDTLLCTAEVKVACVNHAYRPVALPRCKLHDIMTGEPG